ncbi:MAG TPA: DUF202 domain-containing protein [Steroidobacteraceae bacterium]|jgi:putative membrane protein
MTDVAPRFDTAPSASNHFAWLRTRLAIERTLMAWVRTCTALIGFGFTIVQFLQRMADTPGVAEAVRPRAPRYLGLALIGSGIVGLLISVVQYRGLIAYLNRNFAAIAALESGAPRQTPLQAVALGLVLIGIFAFAAIYFRMA